VTAIRSALTAITVALVVGGIWAASGWIAESNAPSVTLALSVGLVGAVTGWLLGLRRSRWLGVCVHGSSILAAAGPIRNLDVGHVWLVVFGAAWLIAPVVVLLGLALGSRTTGRRWTRVATLLCVTTAVGVLTALLGSDIGPGSWTERTFWSPVPPWSRALLVVHVVLLVIAAGVVILPPLRTRNPAVTDDRATWVVAGIWVVTVVIGEVVLLLPRRWLFDGVPGGSGGHRAWASVVSVRLPLLALLAVYATLAHVALVHPRLLRIRSGALVLTDRPLDSVEEELATWTGDPTVRLAYRSGDDRWVDRRGLPFVADDRVGRARTVLMRAGTEVALLEHDAELAAQPGVIDVAASVTSLAVDAEARAAIAAGRVVETGRVSARLLVAEDDARRELLEQLRRGPAARLRDLARAAAAGADLSSISERIRAVTTEVRLLSHGLLPPEFEELGLAGALPDATSVPDRRLPRAVEVTAYLLAREAPGAQLVAGPTLLTIELPTPPTDPHAVDRVHALGGRIDGCTVEIPHGAG